MVTIVLFLTSVSPALQKSKTFPSKIENHVILGIYPIFLLDNSLFLCTSHYNDDDDGDDYSSNNEGVNPDHNI